MKTALLFAMAAFAAAVSAKTRMVFYFDTEDYTCDRSNDAIRDIANILKSEDVKGNFNVVGFLALRLMELGRHDVIDALRHHVIGTQTLYHSRHPDIAELGDDPSYETAYRRTMLDEARGVGMLEAVFGEGRVVFACPPGNSVSAVAFDVYSDLGILFNAATGFYSDSVADGKAYSSKTYGNGLLVRHGCKLEGLWYFNQYHTTRPSPSKASCREKRSHVRTSRASSTALRGSTTLVSTCIHTWRSSSSIGMEVTIATATTANGADGCRWRIAIRRTPPCSTSG